MNVVGRSFEEGLRCREPADLWRDCGSARQKLCLVERADATSTCGFGCPGVTAFLPGKVVKAAARSLLEYLMKYLQDLVGCILQDLGPQSWML